MAPPPRLVPPTGAPGLPALPEVCDNRCHCFACLEYPGGFLQWQELLPATGQFCPTPDLSSCSCFDETGEVNDAGFASECLGQVIALQTAAAADPTAPNPIAWTVIKPGQNVETVPSCSDIQSQNPCAPGLEFDWLLQGCKPICPLNYNFQDPFCVPTKAACTGKDVSQNPDGSCPTGYIPDPNQSGCCAPQALGCPICPPHTMCVFVNGVPTCQTDPPVPNPIPRAFRSNAQFVRGRTLSKLTRTTASQSKPNLKKSLNPTLKIPVPAFFKQCDCGSNPGQELGLVSDLWH